MANPFKIAKKKTIESLDKKGGDIQWLGDRGWFPSITSGHVGNDPPQKFSTFVTEAWRKNAVVRACIQEIVTSLSEAPIKAYEDKESGRRNWVSDHPIEELFEQPNDRDSYVSFIERTGQHYFLGGNTLWHIIRDGLHRPTELIPISPDRIIQADVDERGMPIRFEVSKDGSKNNREWLEIGEVVHIPDIDPMNEVFGMPRLLSAMTEVAADNEATNYVTEVLHNHGSPGSVVLIDTDKVRAQHLIERAEAKWEDKFGAQSGGRGKVAFLPGAHGFQEIGWSLKDLEFPNVRSVSRTSICAVFGIDPMILGVSDRGGTLSGNEHKEARRKLWEQTIIPIIRRWEAGINTFLSPLFGNIKAGFDLRHVEALKENRSDAVARAREMARTGSAQPSEIRDEMGLDSDFSSDEPVVQSGRITYAWPDDLVEEEEEAEEQEEEEEDED